MASVLILANVGHNCSHCVYDVYDQAFNANLKLLGPDLEAWGADQRNLALRMCVHCADIANPAKPLPLALQWTERVVTEFFNQVGSGRERSLCVGICVLTSLRVHARASNAAIMWKHWYPVERM